MTKKVSRSDALLRPWREGVPLLDAVLVKYGPRDVFGPFFLAAAAAARAAGVTIRVHSDFTSLAEANAEIPEANGHLHPPFDVKYSDLFPETAFWMSVHTESGRMVGSCAAKFMQIGDAGLTAEFESMRLFYRDPEPYLAKGAICRVAGPAKVSADAIKGRVTYSGGHWTHPDYRGRGIVYAMVRLTRALAMTRWNTEYTAGITATDLAATNRLHPYGYRKSDRVIHFEKTYAGDFELNLLWMANDWLIADLQDYAELAEAKLARVTDAEETMVPVLPLQGKRRRS